MPSHPAEQQVRAIADRLERLASDASWGYPHDATERADLTEELLEIARDTRPLEARLEKAEAVLREIARGDWVEDDPLTIRDLARSYLNQGDNS